MKEALPAQMDYKQKAAERWDNSQGRVSHRLWSLGSLYSHAGV